jgi:ParB family chromosome partitioning protein
MGKLDDLMRTAGANARRSLGLDDPDGAGVTAPVSPVAVPERLQGLVRDKASASIPLDRIIADADQPREHFDNDGLTRLAESLKARGVLQPLRVRWDETQSRYVLIAGERRWRAAALAGLERVPCVIHDGTPTSEEVLALQLIENVLREDLQPVEQARGFRRLMDAHDWSAREVARELHLPPSNVHRALELLDLPTDVQDLVACGDLPPATACEVGRLGANRVADQVELARQAVDQKLTRAEVVQAVQARKIGRPSNPRSSKLDIKFDDGQRVTVIGTAVTDGPDAVVDLLRRAIKKIQAESRRRDEAA